MAIDLEFRLSLKLLKQFIVTNYLRKCRRRLSEQFDKNSKSDKWNELNAHFYKKNCLISLCLIVYTTTKTYRITNMAKTTPIIITTHAPTVPPTIIGELSGEV